MLTLVHISVLSSPQVYMEKAKIVLTFPIPSVTIMSSLRPKFLGSW